MTKVVTSLRRPLAEARTLLDEQHRLLEEYRREHERALETMKSCLSRSRLLIARIAERIDRQHATFPCDRPLVPEPRSPERAAVPSLPFGTMLSGPDGAPAIGDIVREASRNESDVR